MRIRKLDLFGFKSFPDRTTLHFGSGLACVIGPNGCGKSNIVDAIKWCVGEQSAKSLRGDDMADVIFAGSANRSPVGFAEVQITFTSEGGEPFPGDYARFTEVQVGRRLHRNGTSEYLLNGARVRRKDVVDLFLDTGVGNNLYSFIEQGRIGEIIAASPERRRGLIDEAAGISRYKARRDEAQQRLEATGAQLDRAADVADEMTRRVRVLEAQVLKAARYRRLRALVRHDEILLSLAKYADLAAERRALQASLRDAKTAAGTAERAVQRREDELVARREEVERVEQEGNERRDALAELDARHRELEGALQFARTSLAETADERARVNEQAGEADAEAERVAGELAELVGRGASLDEGLVTARDGAARRQEALEAAITARRDARTALEAREKEAAEAAQHLVRIQTRREELERRSAAFPAALDRARIATDGAVRERDALRDKARKLGAAGDARRAELERVRGEVRAAQERAEVAAIEEKGAREGVAAAEAALEAARREGDGRVAEGTAAALETEKRWRATVSEAERAVAERARAARAAADQDVVRAQEAGRRDVEAAESRAGAWLEALERAEAAALDHSQAAAAERDAASDASDAAGLAGEEAGAREAVARLEADATAALRARLDDLSAELGAARATLERAGAALADLDRRVDTAAREQQELDGRRRGLLAEAEAESARERGAVAVKEALPDARPLVELLDLSESDETWVGTVLDDRLLTPVTTDPADVLRAGEAARRAGRARVLLAPGRPSLDRLLGGVTLVDDLAAALDHHARTGGAAVVRGTGERVEADGLVHLGQAGGAATAALKRRRELGTIERRLAELASEAEELRCAREAATQAASEARAEVDRVDVVLRDAEVEGRRVVAERIETTRAELRQRLEQRAESARRARDGRRDAREAAAADARRRSAATVAEATARARDLLRDLRLEADQRVERAREDAVRAEADARREAEADLARSRAEADAAATAARRAVDAVREDVEGGLVRLREQLASARATAESSRRAREECDAQVSAIRAAQFTAEVAVARAEGDVHASAAAEERLDSRLQDLDQQIAAVRREQIEVAEALAATAMELGAGRADHEACAARLHEAQRVATHAEAAAEAARVAAGEAGVEVASLVERVRATGEAIEAGRRRIDEIRQRRARIAERLVELEVAASGHTARERSTADELGAVATRREEASAALQAARERLGASRKVLREAEAGHRDLVQQRDATAKRLGDTEVRAREVQVEIDGLRERMDERYQVSLTGLLDRLEAQRSLALPVDDEVRAGLEVGGDRVEGVAPLVIKPAMLTDADLVHERLETLETNRRELAALGDVNLGAIAEYQDIAGRHADLLAQRADLEASVQSIREAIAKMNRTCRQRFRDAFDRVNENFQAAYPKLVGGGSARLSLTDEEDLLETGVDIFVQPPGKRLQNLTLLSGGEKAMAAIALLLALFQVKPSPFCLLDEVDAPLDEANGARFNDMLKEMADISQFIVITHNRKTMEAADTLYGITMPAPGVSKLVSVRIGG